MISTFKEAPNGTYYCSNCRMRFERPQASCSYCNALVTNYEELMARPTINTDSPVYETLPSPSGVSRGQRASTNLLIDDFFYSDDLKTALKEYMEDLTNETILH